MNKKTLFITPFLLISVLSGCNKQDNPPVEPDDSTVTSETTSKEDTTSAGEKDEFVKVTGERAKTIFNSLNDVNEKMYNYEGSYTMRYVNADGAYYTTYDALTKRYLDISQEDDETSRTIISLIENDTLNGICYSDKLDSEGKYVADSANYVNVTLDYGRCQRGADTDMSFPNYDALNALSDHPGLYSKMMFAEISAEAGMTIVAKNSTYEFDVLENKVTDRFAFSMKTTATGYVEGDPKQTPIIDIEMDMYLEGDSGFIYSVKNNMKMTMYMGPEPVVQNIDAYEIITKEFDEEAYNAFDFNLEQPETISSYYYNYVTVYYDDMYNYFYLTQLKPGSNFDLATVKGLIEDYAPGLKVDKIYYDAEHTREFKGITSLYYYYTDLYITAGPKDDYVEVKQNFSTKYEYSEDDTGISGDFTPEELEIIEMMYPNNASDSESIYLKSYFYQKSEVSSAGIPIKLAATDYATKPFEHVYLGDSESEYTKSTFPYDASKSVYEVTLTKTVIDSRNGTTQGTAIRLIDDYGIYYSDWGVLYVDLGALKKGKTLYFALDGEKYDFWGSQIGFYKTSDKADKVNLTNLKVGTDLDLECFYVNSSNEKVALEYDEPDIMDVPKNTTIYFKITAKVDFEAYSVMELL